MLMKAFLKYFSIFIGALLVLFWLIPLIFIRPSLERNWTPDQRTLARIQKNTDETVTIKNIRNIDYRSTTDYTPSYYDATYNPKEIVRAWFLVEPFGSFGAAHTLVSFEFKDGRYLSLSAEIRKEVGETFSPLKGLLRQYELVYVIADERDVVRLRTNYRKDPVYLYPIKSTPEKLQAVFLDMLKRANKLSQEPEMYNTLTNNCTTNIVHHVRKFSDRPIPWWNITYMMPENVDALAYKIGMIDTPLSFEEARSAFYITKKAQENDTNPDFSTAIRN